MHDKINNFLNNSRRLVINSERVLKKPYMVIQREDMYSYITSFVNRLETKWFWYKSFDKTYSLGNTQKALWIVVWIALQNRFSSDRWGIMPPRKIILKLAIPTCQIPSFFFLLQTINLMALMQQPIAWKNCLYLFLAIIT